MGVNTVTVVERIECNTAVESEGQGHDRFSGVVVPLITPLTRTRDIDEEAVHRVVDHVVGGGVDGILALGTTGEFVSMDLGKRRRLLELVARANAGRVTLYAGVGDTSLDSTLAISDAAASAGADAIAVVPPYYFPLTEDQLVGFYRHVVRASGLPVMLYNIPGFTRVDVTNRVVREVMDAGQVIGIKDSSGNFDTLCGFITEFRKPGAFRVMVGSEALAWKGIQAGGDGLIPSSANACPELWSKYYAALKSGVEAEARACQEKVDAQVNALMQGTTGWPGYLKNLKVQLAEKFGLCQPWLASPLEPMD